MKVLWGAIACVVIAILLHSTAGWLIAGMIGLAVGAAVTIFLLARSRGESPESVAKEVVKQATQPDPGALERPIHEQLCRLNLRLRLEAASTSVITGTESLIDLLREVAPKAQSDAPGSETTFDLVRLATDHLPKLVGEYLDLSPADRGKKEAELTAQLSKLAGHVSNVQKLLDQGRLDEFDAAKGFVDIKFNS